MGPPSAATVANGTQWIPAMSLHQILVYVSLSSGVATVLKGVAFAPSTPGAQTPEAPLALLLPLAAGAGLAGYVVWRRRRRIA